MNIFAKVTWKAMWKNRVRTLVTIAGVILSAAMFTAVTTMAASLLQFLVDVEVYEDGSHFLSWDIADERVGQALRADEAVDQVGDYQALGYVYLGEENSDSAYIMGAVEPQVYELAGLKVEEGRLPAHSGELLLPLRAVERLESLGLPNGLGDSLTVDIQPDYVDADLGLPSGTETFTRTYTIVGITSDTYIGAAYEYIPSLITVSDGTETALWHRYFATTFKAKEAEAVAERLATNLEVGTALHYELLSYYGASRYANYNTMMATFVLVLVAIIMVGAVSLIYNAFSISVAERTKQFGLLSSVGATKRQLRRSVLFEAGALSLLGIPLGLLCGWGGIAVTLHFVGGLFGDMLAGAGDSGITLHAVVSPAALLAASLIGLLTVFLSAWIPARRATRVPPMAAIRQSGDYQVTRRQVKVSRLSYRLWGLPGVLAKKYYAVSRRKYRATVISLAISVLLFITATSYADTLRGSVALSMNTENYDLMAVWVDQGNRIDLLRGREDVSQSALVRADDQYYVLLSDEMMSAEHRAWIENADSFASNFDANCRSASIYYLEDAVFRDYLEEHKIDPTPYFDRSSPTALVCNRQFTSYEYDDEKGWSRYTTAFTPFAEDVGALELFYGILPQALLDELDAENYYIDRFTVENGRLMLNAYHLVEDPDRGMVTDWNDRRSYVIQTEGDTQRYYVCDPLTGSREAEPAYTQDVSDTLQHIRLGAAIDELPFGIGSRALENENSLYFILPLSMAKGEPQYGVDMALRTSNYDSLKAFLDEQEIPYSDLLDSEMRARNIILLVNVFSYGFIILIALICVCNVFNTISTNIALRRRDFGMLRSVGLKSGELYRMMHFECLRYGVKALLAGLPLALLASYGIHGITTSFTERSWQPPWLAIAVAAGSIFLVVFATMLYAVTKLRKDNPIEAIRMENL